MSHHTQIVSKFFSLIRISLGEKPNQYLIISPEEWDKIFNLSAKQSLLGVLFPALNKISEYEQIPREVLLRWLGSQSRTIAKNKLLDKRAAELTAILKELNMRTCVFKGQSVALYYPQPELREPGDIDIWVDGKPKDIISKIQKKYNIGTITYHHVDVQFFKDVEVEVHYKASWLCNPFLNVRLQKFFLEQKEIQMTNPSGKGFFSPTPLFDSIHSLVHIYRHFFQEGIGLRQMMDYFYILKALPKEDKPKTLLILSRLKMNKFLASVMFVMQEVFGMEDEFLLCPADTVNGSFLLDEILRAGNFGKFDIENVHKKNESKLHRFIRETKRQQRFVKSYPQEVLWIPFWRLWHNLGRSLRLWL